MMKQKTTKIKASIAFIELKRRTHFDGSKEFFLTTISSEGVKKVEWFNNETHAVKKMKQVLSYSSCFRSDWHDRVCFQITKDFIS